MNAPQLPIVLPIGDVATTVTRKAQYQARGDQVLTAVAVCSETALAAHASNIYSLIVYDRGSDDSGTAEIAKLTSDTDVTSSVAVATAGSPHLGFKAVLGGTAHADDADHTGAIGSNVPAVLDLSSDNPLAESLGYGYNGIGGYQLHDGDVVEVSLTSTGQTLDESTVTLYFRPGSN